MFRTGFRQFKLVRSWVVVYAGFMAAIVFAEHGMAMTFPGPEAVSPVLIGADVPIINIEPVVRRLDI